MTALEQVLDLTSYLPTRLTVPPIVMGLVALGLGLWVLARERGSRVGLTFWLFSLGVGVWLFSLGAACAADTKPLALWWLRWANVGLTFLPTLVYLFTLSVVNRLREFRLYVVSSVIISGIFCLGSVVTDWFIRGLERGALGYALQYGPLNSLFLVFLFGMMAASLRLYWVEYRRTSFGTQKQRLEGLLLAFCVAYLGSFDYLASSRAQVYPFGYLPIFVFFLMATRAIQRSRLADVTAGFASSQILDTMQGAVLVTDLKGHIHIANRAAADLLGCRESRLLGLSIAEAVGAELPAELQVAELLRQPTVRDRTMAWHTQQGHSLEVSVSASLLRRRNDFPAGVIYVALDITQRRESEERLKAANKRLEELAVLKDEFVAKASHELRTPLTAIKEGISLTLEGALGGVNAEQHEFLAMVDQNIDRLTELINTMLDLSKIEAGRLRLARRRVAVAPLIETTMTSYKPLAGQRRIVTQVGTVPEVFADPNRLLQVLGNLLSNAVKFTNEDGMITFAAQERDGHVAICVRDNGEGIAEEDLPKLFQKFSQVGPEGIKPKGSGLGLVLCRELVELHKGTIGVESELGKGTAFTLTLPLYTTQFALEDEFREFVTSVHRREYEAIGVIALDAEPFLQRLPEGLEGVAEFLRKHVHQGDVVVGLESRWVVVLALTHAAGAPAFVKRLRDLLQAWASPTGSLTDSEVVRLGAACYPADGTDVQRLVTKATQSLNQGLAAPGVREGAGRTEEGRT